MQNKNVCLSPAKYLILSLLVLFFAAGANAAQLFHTIQVSSFTNVDSAQKQFASIMKKLDEKDLDHLRIEKIGKFFAVRIGKFDNSNSAQETLKAIKSQIPKASIMTAYIKEERIVRIFTMQPVPEQEEALLQKEPEQIKPEVALKTDNMTTPGKGRPAVTEKPDIQTGPRDLKEILPEIAGLVGQGDFDNALDTIKKEIALRPGLAELNAWYGMVLLKMDKPLDALPYLTRAVELSPGISDYHNALGYSLFFLNRFDRAIDEFGKAVDLDPDHFDALTGLCIVYARAGKKEKALGIYNKIKDVDQDVSAKLLRIINKSV